MIHNNKSLGSKIFDGFNYIFLGTFALTTILPFIYVIAGSFATEKQLSTEAFFLIPKEVQLDAYKYILSSNTIINSAVVAIFITITGTIINLFFSVTMAYPLSKKELVGRNKFINLVIITMVFSGGLIPTFLVVKGLGLLDTFWALMLPVAISPFNLIVVKCFFQEIPKELEEAAIIDGCSQYGVLWKIILPLSKPVLAAVGLFYAVAHWNSFFSALIFLSSPEKWPLQVILRQMVMLAQISVGNLDALDSDFVKPAEQAIKMAVIVVSVIPILCVYPFIQKYFTKGVMVGGIKG